MLWHLFAWLGLGLIGASFPCLLKLFLFAVVNAPSTLRDIFGYSTVLMIGFGIFLSSAGDLIADGNYARIGGAWMLAVGIFGTLSSLLVGTGSTIDAFKEAGQMSAGPQFAENLWMWVECGLSFFLIVIASAIRVRVWQISNTAVLQGSRP